MNESKAYIDLDILSNNVKSIINKYSDYKYYIGVLKSNAYGHGEYIVNELVKSGINYIAVSVLSEALRVRNYNKDIPILIMEPISLNDLDIVLKNNLTITVHDIDYLKELLKINKSIKVHIKIDSGMNRLGFKDKEEIKETVELLNNSNYILEGIYTHFATIGLFDPYYDKQVNNFKELTSLIDLNNIPIVHLASSMILVSHKKLEFANGFRTGVLLYGYNSSVSFNNSGIKNKLRNMRNKFYQNKYNLSEFIYDVELDVKPAISIKTPILQIKKVNKGEVVGYGAKYTSEEDMTIAVLPIGYNNGIGTNNERYVLINDNKYQVIGEIAMNMMIIKIDDKVSINDEVTILGDSITLGKFSTFSNSPIFKTLIDLGKNNRKYYKKDGKIVYIEEMN